MNVQLQSTANVATNGIKNVVYGPPKIGKTRLIATAPAPVIISTEKGLLSLRKFNIPYIDVSTVAELANAYNWLRSPQSNQFATFGFDSISDLGEVVLGDNKKKTKDGRKAHGDTIDTVMQIFRDFRDVPNKNVYFVAKEQQYIGANNMPCTRPLMPNASLTSQLPYMFDGVYHYEFVRFTDGNLYEALRTRSDQQTLAGDRSGTLAEYEPPNLAQIYAKIAKG